jgi:hypothetical protein
MRELGIRYGLGDPHAMPRSRCALSPRAVCHAACPPATRATTKSDGSLERFAFLSLAAQDPRPKSATEILVPRGAPRAPVKNGAKKRVKPRRARTRRDARRTTQRPQMSSIDPHAHRLSIARLRSGRSAREGHWRAYTLPPKNRRYRALGLLHSPLLCYLYLVIFLIYLIFFGGGGFVCCSVTRAGACPCRGAPCSSREHRTS